VAGVALLLALAAHLSAAQPTVKSLSADHEAVQALQAALASGQAFELSFAALPEARTEAARERLVRGVKRALLRLRAKLPEEPAYEFLHGVEFTVPKAEERTVDIRHPVGDETADHPSLFRLPAKHARQVYVLFRVMGKGLNRAWRLHALMVPEGGGWKSSGLTLLLSRLDSMDADAALAAGKKQAQAGHGAVALALYGLANELGKTPRYRRAGLHARLDAAHQALTRKLGVPEKPVTTVTTRGGTFTISYTNARVFSRGAYLVLFREAPMGQRPAAWQQHQQRLAAAFLKARPELKPYFVGIAINERYTDAEGVEHDDRSLFHLDELASPSDEG
jgi:hypothetical protein